MGNETHKNLLHEISLTWILNKQGAQWSFIYTCNAEILWLCRHWCIMWILVFMPKDICKTMSRMSSYLNGRFYTKFVINYLMAVESFYATAIDTKCIINSPLGDIHKEKILCQPIKMCINRVLVIMWYQYYITVVFLYT